MLKARSKTNIVEKKFKNVPIPETGKKHTKSLLMSHDVRGRYAAVLYPYFFQLKKNIMYRG